MTLYEIDQRLEQIYNDSIDPETGETHGEILDELLRLYEERDKKIENFALWHKNCVAEAEAIDKEIKTLQERAKSLKTKIRWIDSVLFRTLDGDRFETAKVQIGYRKSTQVDFEDYDDFMEENIGTELVREKVEHTPNKELIKKLLKAGEKIKGAYLVENLNMQIK